MAKPFVKIDNGKLTLMTDAKFENAKVVSILGKARMGKSSFLNCLAAHMTNENKRIFATKGTFEHVTKGVDYYYIADKNILLLDTQGLDHEDSSHDPILLLFVYLISDIIIFNGTNQLQNDTLKLLEPICAFMHSVDLEEIVKPRLFFRIANAFPIVLENPLKSLDTINVCYDDQYQSIRDSIRLLFQDDIDVVATDHLNKSATAFIDAGTFKPLLEDAENGFLPAIEKVLDALLKPSDKNNKYLHKMPEVIKQINNNEKINISKLDVVALTAENDILQWLQHCDATNYAPIEVDGLQKTYVDLVEPRKLKKKAILSAFTRKFNSVPEKIKSRHYNDLNAKLSEPITKAIQECVTKAEDRVERANRYMINTTLPKINSIDQSFTNVSEDFILQYLKVYYDLEVFCEDIYEPVKEKYVKICTDAYDTFNKVLNEQKEKEEVYMEQATTVCNKVVANFVATETSKAEDTNTFAILQRTNDEIVKGCVDLTLAYVKNDLQKSICYSEIQGIIKGYVLSFIVTGVTSDRNIETYDLTSSMWESFRTSIKDLSKGLLPVWTDVKKKLLEGYHFDIKYPKIMQMIMKNPEIQFTSNNLVEECFIDNDTSSVAYFTTVETYEEIYKPVIQEVVDDMKSKGYYNPTYTLSYEINTSRAENAVSWKTSINNKINPTSDEEFRTLLNNKYRRNSEEILIHKLKKMYCKKSVEGEDFTSLLEASELV